VLSEQGRDPSSFVFGKRAYLAIDRPLEKLRGLQEVGTDLLILNPIGGELEQFDVLAQDVLPKLR
jgi:hypothetical protein